MEQFIVNLLAERDQLNDRLNKLNVFIETEKFMELDMTHRNLLVSQQYHMTELLSILNKRLKLLGEK